jgi:hypothetical protein
VLGVDDHEVSTPDDLMMSGLMVYEIVGVLDVSRADVDADGTAGPATGLAGVAAFAATDVEYPIAFANGKMTAEIDADDVIGRGYFLRSAMARS